jgi:hypothetical protein
MSQNLMIIFLGILTNTAFAQVWMEYPVRIDFGSKEACSVAASTLDKNVVQAEISLYVQCHDGVMTGIITAPSQLKNVTLRLDWPKGIDISCYRLQKSFQKTEGFTCESQSEGNRSIARFTYPFINGKELSQVQNERISALQKQKDAREDSEDKRACEASANSDGMIDRFLRYLYGRPCKWRKDDADPAVSNVILPNKPGRVTGGTATDSKGATKSGSLTLDQSE